MRKRLGMLLAGAMMLAGVAATDAQARVDARDDGPFTVVSGGTLRISISDLLDNDRFSGRSNQIRFSGIFFNKKSQGVRSARVNRNGIITIRFREGFTGQTRLRYVIRGLRNGRVLLGREFDIASIKFRVRPSPG